MTAKSNPFQPGNVWLRAGKSGPENQVTVIGLTASKVPLIVYVNAKGQMRTRKQDLFVDEYRLQGFDANVSVGMSVVEGRIDGTSFRDYVEWEERVRLAAAADTEEGEADDLPLKPLFDDAGGQAAILAQQQLNVTRLDEKLVSASVELDYALNRYRLKVMLAGTTMMEAQDMFSPLVLGSIVGVTMPLGNVYKFESLEAITPMVADATYLTVHLTTSTPVAAPEEEARPDPAPAVLMGVSDEPAPEATADTSTGQPVEAPELRGASTSVHTLDEAGVSAVYPRGETPVVQNLDEAGHYKAEENPTAEAAPAESTVVVDNLDGAPSES